MSKKLEFHFISSFFCRCICQALRKKVSVLVTHQLQYLQAASQILILKEVGGDKFVFGKLAMFRWLRLFQHFNAEGL